MRLVASLPSKMPTDPAEWLRITQAWEEMKRVLNSVVAGPTPPGTVTSVGLTMPTEFGVAGSPVTTSGVLAVTKASQLANLVWASPNGGPGLPTFRALVAGDIPSLPYLPSSTVLAQTFGAVASQFLKSYNAGTGLFTAAQPALTDDSDVLITTPANGELLTYETASSKWKNKPGGVFAQTIAKVASKWLDSYNATTGLFTQSQPTEADLSMSDITTNNVSITQHGFVPKAPNNTTQFLRGDGSWASPGAAGYTNTPPNEANFSWVNQGTYVVAGGTTTPSYLYSPSGATGVNLHCRVMTAPATPWSFRMRGSAKTAAGGGVIWRFGIVVRDSGTGKMVTIDIDVNAAWFANGHIGAPHVIKWNSATSFSAFYSPTALLGVNGVDFRFINFKVVNDGTNLKWYVDPLKQQGDDTENWQLIQSNTKTDFLATIDQVGYFSDNEGTGAFAGQVYDWIQGVS